MVIIAIVIIPWKKISPINNVRASSKDRIYADVDVYTCTSTMSLLRVQPSSEQLLRAVVAAALIIACPEVGGSRNKNG